MTSNEVNEGESDVKLKCKIEAKDDLIVKLEEQESKHDDIVNALECKLEDKERRLQMAYKDIEDLEQQKMELTREKKRSEKIVSRYVVKIKDLEENLQETLDGNDSENEAQKMKIIELEENNKKMTASMEKLKKEFTAKQNEWMQSENDMKMESDLKIKAIQEAQEQLVALEKKNESEEYQAKLDKLKREIVAMKEEKEKSDRSYKMKFEKLKQDITRKSEEVDSLKKQLVTQQSQQEYQRSIFQTKISERNQALSASDLKLDRTSKIVDRQEKMVQEKRTEIAEKEKIINGMKTQILQLQQYQNEHEKRGEIAYRDLEKLYNQKLFEIEKMVAEKKELREDLSIKEMEHKEVETELDKKKKEYDRLMEEKREYENDATAYQADLEEMDEQMAMNAKLEKKILKNKTMIKKMKEELKESKQKEKEWKAKMTAMSAMSKKNEKQKERAEKEREKERKKLENKISKLKDKLIASKATLKGITETSTENEALIQSKIDVIKQKEKTIERMKRRMDELENETFPMRKMKGELQTCKRTLREVVFKLMKRNEDIRKLQVELEGRRSRRKRKKNAQTPMNSIDALREEFARKRNRKRRRENESSGTPSQSKKMKLPPTIPV